VTGQVDFINSLAFSPDGSMLATSGTGDEFVHLWDPVRRTVIGILQRSLDSGQTQSGSSYSGYTGVWGLAFSPDGRLLAVAGDQGRAWLWDPVRRTYVKDWVTGPPAVITTGVAFSPDGRTLAVAGDDGSVTRWGLADPGAPRDETGSLRADSQQIEGVAYGPAGVGMVTASLDGDVRIWGAVPALTVSTQGVVSMALSADGTMIATVDVNGVARVWDTSPATVAARICQTLAAPIDRTTWRNWADSIPYTPVCP
jgi:WD40 repeat protein